MEQQLYQRPREKICEQGVQSLSDVELVQVIMGSGGKGVSVGRIAKELESCLKQQPLMLETLLQIKGVGEAKACQLLASIELGTRYSDR